MKQGKRNFNWFIGLMLLVMGYFSYAIIEQNFCLRAIAQEQAVIDMRKQEALKINEELQKEKKNLETPEYIEKIAREELGMTRPDEIPYISSKK